jgi:hypothetical protein
MRYYSSPFEEAVSFIWFVVKSCISVFQSNAFTMAIGFPFFAQNLSCYSKQSYSKINVRISTIRCIVICNLGVSRLLPRYFSIIGFITKQLRANMFALFRTSITSWGHIMKCSYWMLRWVKMRFRINTGFWMQHAVGLPFYFVICFDSFFNPTFDFTYFVMGLLLQYFRNVILVHPKNLNSLFPSLRFISLFPPLIY